MSQPLSGRGRKRTTRARKGKGSAETNPSRPEPRVLTTMRLRQSLRKDLEATAARNRRSVAHVAQELLDEALRMRHCPGIYFADEPSGRTAKIGGTVWACGKSCVTSAGIRIPAEFEKPSRNYRKLK